MKLHTISELAELIGDEVRLTDRNGWSSPIFKVISNYSATQCERTFVFPPEHNVFKALQRNPNIVISTGAKFLEILDCGEVFDCGRVVASWAKVEVVQND